MPLDVEWTRRVLRSCGEEHEIVVASDGEEALRELIQCPDFDIVLLDLKLPKVDGFEVLKEISSKPFLSDIPVIVLSDSRNEADRMRTRMLGACEFVEKAMDYTEFDANLRRCLAQHGFCHT